MQMNYHKEDITKSFQFLLTDMIKVIVPVEPTDSKTISSVISIAIQ